MSSTHIRYFQNMVREWAVRCFGKNIADDRSERTHRFVEEALELAQACNCPREDVLQLVDYVYGRPVGERAQEVGGVMTTLAALCAANGLDLGECAYDELNRILANVDKIRAKQAAKPKFGPLPGAVS